MKVSTVEEMHKLDRNAIEKYGVTGIILMENAGEAAYFVILKELGVKGKKFVVFCGSGHNGGDGLVVARKLYSTGAKVKVYSLSTPEKFDETVSFHYEMVKRANIEFKLFEESSDEEILQDIKEADAVIDAMLGTGIKGEVRGKYRKAIEFINRASSRVFSIDIPSGVNGDTGEIMGIAVKADYTITYGLPKRGNLLYPGFEYGGKLYVSHISFPPENYETDEIKVQTIEFPRLKERPGDGHKGTFGKALFVAGSVYYLGAPYFSAMSFLKAGGGLSYLATVRSIISSVATRGSEIIFVPMEETPEGSIAFKNRERIIEASKDMDIMVIGPGVSLNSETQKLVIELLRKLEKPVIVDGDGLTALSKEVELLKERPAPTVLTPHPGEMARLMGIGISEIKKRKIELVQEFAEKFKVYVVLKGAHSLIGYPDGQVFINLSGNPGMGTAGSGDVLNGTIAAMFTAFGLDMGQAVQMGVFIHGLSGDLMAEEKSQDGLVARDILEGLPIAIKYYRENFEKVKESFYGKISVI